MFHVRKMYRLLEEEEKPYLKEYLEGVKFIGISEGSVPEYAYGMKFEMDIEGAVTTKKRAVHFLEYTNKRIFDESVDGENICLLYVAQGKYVNEIGNVLKFLKSDACDVPENAFRRMEVEDRYKVLCGIEHMHEEDVPAFCSISGYEFHRKGMEIRLRNYKDHLKDVIPPDQDEEDEGEWYSKGSPGIYKRKTIENYMEKQEEPDSDEEETSSDLESQQRLIHSQY